MGTEERETREYGTQRLDAVMRAWGLDNHDLVLAGGAEEQLTHKQVQRARNGRRLTLGMMQKVSRVLNIAIGGRLSTEQREAFRPYLHRDLFSYAKGYDAAWADPNSPLYPAVNPTPPQP